jgi:hypothetical protein
LRNFIISHCKPLYQTDGVFVGLIDSIAFFENECSNDNLENGENELIINNTLLEKFITIQKHPQRDLWVKWKLADFSTGDLGHPYYINNL